MSWFGLFLDLVLIGVVGAGVVQATRLIQQLRDLRASRAEMDRFVRDFNTAVIRAEAGIKTLRAASRESGDDLEKLVEKANMVRDELNFIVDSADSVADRLTKATAAVLHEKPAVKPALASEPTPVATRVEPHAAPKPAPTPFSGKIEKASRAEQELMMALKKLG